MYVGHCLSDQTLFSNFMYVCCAAVIVVFETWMMGGRVQKYPHMHFCREKKSFDSVVRSADGCLCVQRMSQSGSGCFALGAKRKSKGGGQREGQRPFFIIQHSFPSRKPIAPHHSLIGHDSWLRLFFSTFATQLANRLRPCPLLKMRTRMSTSLLGATYMNSLTTSHTFRPTRANEYFST